MTGGTKVYWLTGEDANFLSLRFTYLRPLALWTSTRCRLSINAALGLSLYWMRRYDEAIAQFRKTTDLDPNYWWGLENLANALVHKGELSEALRDLHKAASGETPRKRQVISGTPTPSQETGAMLRRFSRAWRSNGSANK